MMSTCIKKVWIAVQVLRMLAMVKGQGFTTPTVGEYIFCFSVHLCVYSLNQCQKWLKFGDKMQILSIIGPTQKFMCVLQLWAVMAGWFCG